jgi:hypothetical protein
MEDGREQPPMPKTTTYHSTIWIPAGDFLACTDIG